VTVAPFLETAEHGLLRESVRGVVAQYGHAYYVEKARARGQMSELWAALGEHGFLGVNLPEEHGGGGMGMSELAIVAEECAAAGCPVLLLAVSPTICGSIIARHGTDEQKREWLPAIASGELTMAFAITEPDAGSNSHRVATVATQDDGDWVLRGTKQFISGIDEAQAVLVVARTGEEGRLGLFVVPTDASGFSKQEIPVEIVAPEKQYTLFFDDVRVGEDALVGEAGEGLRAAFAGLNPERIMGAATVNGIALYALRKAAEYARERRVWDAPIGSHQGVAHPLAKAKIEVELARLMTQKAAGLYDAGLDAGEASNMAKYAAAEASLGALDQAIQTHGGLGLASETGLADLWFAVRLVRTAPVSREMILNYVAQHSLGLPRSY
jgi:alkylation response protein AidB-like acyl-CoA dehydrogenase